MVTTFGKGLAFFLLGILTAAQGFSPEFSEAGQAAEISVPEILSKMENTYRTLSAYTADFTQWTTSVASSGATTKAHGVFYYQKPYRMRWEYEAPDRQIFVAFKDTAWLYIPEDRQISLLEMKELLQSPVMRTFFEGVVQLKENFQATLDAASASEETAVLRLTPKQEDPNVRDLRVWVDTTAYTITEIEAHDALGNINRIQFHNQKYVPNLPKELFAFNPDETVVVLDPSGRKLHPEEIGAIKRRLGD
ncbi:MAG: outer membrane lipoprotein carrier protein LolA [Desulfosoma sp.]